ncbi:MAG: hypothetical protein KGJ57_00055 [Sphingomonadales bacterium]|nr:hypothetical protein [Sphingomonadales bacterium]MDE2167800.1 hypothetical protein [Sphingomonadales bacterium]
MAFDPNDFYPSDIEALWKGDPKYIGPVLLTRGEDIDKYPLCGFCPQARWYVKNHTPYVFCKEFHENMPNNIDEGVTNCDTFAMLSGRIKPAVPEA